MYLEERTVGGLHDFVVETVLPSIEGRGGSAIDLGAGSGAFATRLRGMGYDVTAVDRDIENFKADVPLLGLDLDSPDFASQLQGAKFDLVTTLEVIEHVQSPIGFLRAVRALLKPSGLAVLTTPNVDSLPARLKFLLTGRVRMMDEAGDATHISPIFWDLLNRQLLPRAGLQLVRRYGYPARGFKVSRAPIRLALGAIARTLGNPVLLGDNHILLLKPLS